MREIINTSIIHKKTQLHNQLAKSVLICIVNYNSKDSAGNALLN